MYFKLPIYIAIRRKKNKFKIKSKHQQMIPRILHENMPQMVFGLY